MDQVSNETTGRDLVEHLIHNDPDIAQDRERFVQQVSQLFDEYTTVKNNKRIKRIDLIPPACET